MWICFFFYFGFSFTNTHNLWQDSREKGRLLLKTLGDYWRELTSTYSVAARLELELLVSGLNSKPTKLRTLIYASFGAIALSFPLFLLMIRHEKMLFNANRNPNPISEYESAMAPII